MQAAHYLIGKVLRLFWWPAVVATIFVIGSGAIALWQAGVVPTSLAGSGSSLDRWNRGCFLAASVRNAAVLVRDRRTDNMQILLVDFETGKRIRLKSERSHLLSPYLSPDGTRLLFSRQTASRSPGPRTCFLRNRDPHLPHDPEKCRIDPVHDRDFWRPDSLRLESVCETVRRPDQAQPQRHLDIRPY